jgi:hypothetical protein
MGKEEERPIDPRKARSPTYSAPAPDGEKESVTPLPPARSLGRHEAPTSPARSLSARGNTAASSPTDPALALPPPAPARSPSDGDLLSNPTPTAASLPTDPALALPPPAPARSPSDGVKDTALSLPRSASDVEKDSDPLSNPTPTALSDSHPLKMTSSGSGRSIAQIDADPTMTLLGEHPTM